LVEIYRKLRPGDPPTVDTATQLFQGMFFDPRKYDFSRVGRMKFNIKLYDRSDSTALDKRTLDSEDFKATIKVPAEAAQGHRRGGRYRSPRQPPRARRGRIAGDQFRIGLVRMERAIKEKMSVYQEMSTAMPHDLVNAKPVMAAIREFFGSSQLSQFMDQTNPLSEITHKRRLSAPGTRRFEPGARRIRSPRRAPHALRPHMPHRDPRRSEHRPDLVALLLRAHQRVRLHRESYRKVIKGAVVDETQVLKPGDSDLKVGDIMRRTEVDDINRKLGAKKQPVEFEAHCEYLSAWEEDKWTIAQANVELDEKGRIVPELVDARQAGNFVLKGGTKSSTSMSAPSSSSRWPPA